jgi:hypothetical protein
MLTSCAGRASAQDQAAGHGVHPPLPSQEFSILCRVKLNGEITEIQEPVKIPLATSPSDLDQTVNLPDPLPPIRLVRYLPRAVLKQKIVPDEKGEGQPAIMLFIEGPTQSFQRWLVADDPERNRLSSFIATWRYMAVEDRERRDELFRQFKTELTRPPVLIINRPDGTAAGELPAEPGTAEELKDLGCTVRVLRFLPHFGQEKEDGKIVNRSDRRLNPAALVEMEQGDRKEQRWVFAKFPDFKMGESQTLPLRVKLDCPAEKEGRAPDFVLVTVGRRENEVWRRLGSEVTARPLLLDQRTEVTGSQYTFRIGEYVRSGRLLEEYKAAEVRGAIPALQIETSDPSGARVSLWLGSDKPHIMPTEKGPMMVKFGPRSEQSSGGRQWSH